MLIAAVKDGHQNWLVIFAVLCAAISAYYYFKVIQAIYFKETNTVVTQDWDITPAFKILLIITAFLIIIIGIFPTVITNWLHY